MIPWKKIKIVSALAIFGSVAVIGFLPDGALNVAIAVGFAGLVGFVAARLQES